MVPNPKAGVLFSALFLVTLASSCSKPKAKNDVGPSHKAPAVTSKKTPDTPLPQPSPTPGSASRKSTPEHEPPPFSEKERGEKLGAALSAERRALRFHEVQVEFGVDKHRDVSDEAVARGRRAAKKQDWRKAVLEFEHAVARDSLNVTARGELGYAHQQLDKNAIALLRSAESLATRVGAPMSVRAAIAHNLATGYEMNKEPVLAARAKNRSRSLSGTGSADQACPVVVSVSAKEKPFANFMTWLELYRWVVEDQAAEWGKPPKTDEAARELLCKRVQPSPHGEPALQGKTRCEVGRAWSLGTTYGARTTVHLLWPLADGRVAVTTSGYIGSPKCEVGIPDQSLGFDNFLVHKTEASQYFNETPTFGSFDECAAVAIEHSLSLYDVTLEREYEFDGLSSDVHLELYPEEHAVNIRGRFCEQRIKLAECDSGVCISNPL